MFMIFKVGGNQWKPFFLYKYGQITCLPTLCHLNSLQHFSYSLNIFQILSVVILNPTFFLTSFIIWLSMESLVLVFSKFGPEPSTVL